MKRCFDLDIERSQKIPSPDKYTGQRESFNDQTKRSKIYMFDRKSELARQAEETKKMPGVGRYETTKFDEKYNKPPKGNYKLTTDN